MQKPNLTPISTNEKISRRSYFTFIILLFAGFWSANIAQDMPDTFLVINEILYYQDNNALESKRDHEWIELFNGRSETVQLEGYTISNRTGSTLLTLPSINFPPAAYLVIHLKQGTNEFDFSDSTGHYYTQENHLITDRFSEVQDEIALYAGSPTINNMIDFLAWKASDEEYEPGNAHDMAVVAGIWQDNDFLNTLNNSPTNVQKIKRVYKGASIGRDRYSINTNTSEDWDVSGGKNSFLMTPGEVNLTQAQVRIGPPIPIPADEWTFMVYIAADNNLEGAGFRDMEEMEMVGSSDDVNIVVMVDFAPKYIDVNYSADNGTTFIPTEGTFRGLIKQDLGNPKRVTLYPPPGETALDLVLGEKNMGTPGTLGEFLTWGMGNFPANKYALVIWDHGGGWKNTTFDDSEVDEFHMHELTTALSMAPGPLDLIGFDQCLMAMVEVAHQTADFADVFVASEEVEWDDGWPYHLILDELKATPAISASTLGEVIVENYDHYYDSVGIDERTMSAINLNNDFDMLINYVSNFGQELHTGMNDYNYLYITHYDSLDNVQIKVRGELFQTEKFDDPNYIDLAHFSERIDNNAGIPLVYKTRAPLIANQFTPMAGLVIAEEHGPGHPNANGLSIYFPAYQTKEKRGDPYDDPFLSYKTAEHLGNLVKYSFDPDDCTPDDPPNHPLEPAPGFKFTNDTQWDEFLHRYYEPCADAGADTFVYEFTLIYLNGSGSSDADGRVTRWYWDLEPTENTDTLNLDRDCPDETNDDLDLEGERTNFFAPAGPATLTIVLTVWDDHNLQGGHSGHFETDQDTMVVTVIPTFRIDTVEYIDLTCANITDAIATIYPVGGAIPYTYAWPDGQTTQTAVNLAAGTYTVTVTDSLGTAITQEITISSPPMFNLSITTEHPQCPGEPVGAIALFAEGGTPPYTYLWTTGSTEPVITDLFEGEYSVTITDANDCEYTETIFLPAMDITLPTVVTQDIVITLDPETNLASITPDMVVLEVYDNCGILYVELSQTTFDCSHVGLNEVPVTVVDVNGNAVIVTPLVTVLDPIGPAINAQDIVVQLDENGQIIVPPEILDAGSTDNCGIAGFELDINNFSCENIGPNEVTFTIFDGSFNSASTTAIIIVEDILPPIIQVQDITVFLNEEGIATVDVSQIDVGTFDNCGIQSLEIDQTTFDCSDIPPNPNTEEPFLYGGRAFDTFGVDTILFTATDIHGNQISTPVYVTILDEIDPIITCPADIITTQCGPVEYELPIFIDNCTATLELVEGLGSGAFFSIGEHVEIYQVTDLSGNAAVCSFVIEVNSDIAWTVVDIFNETNGQGNGYVSLLVSGGTPPYSFEGVTFQDTLTLDSLSAGTYIFSILDASGCEIIAEIWIENVSGVELPQYITQLEYFPNPVNDILTVNVVLDQSRPIRLNLVNATGQHLQRWPVIDTQESTYRIDVSDLPAGIYWILLEVEDTRVSRKIIVSD